MSNLSQAERDKLPESSFGDPAGRRYPILDQDDVDSAAHLIGKASDPEKVKKRIIAIAKRLGLSIPDAWKEDGKSASPVLERKTFSFEVKELGDGDSGNGDYSIYAAEFHTLDRANEKIAPGAFENLTEFVRDGFMAINHKWDIMPIATIDSAVMDSTGLLVKGEFHSTPEAQSARTIMRERMDRGKRVSASIGYQVTKDAKVFENGKAFRLLKGIQLYEFSWVNVPANPSAVALDVKSADASATKDASDALSEGDDSSGGATVPEDSAPAIGAHVKWGAYAKGMDPGCGSVKALFTDGTHGGLAATKDAPVASVYACKDLDEMGMDESDAETKAACRCGDGEAGDETKAAGKCVMTKGVMHHPADELDAKPGTPKPFDADEKAAADAPDAIPPVATKGALLGNTDEAMACAAFDQLHRLLAYYVYGQLNSDAEPDDVTAKVGAAVDEYKGELLRMLGGILIADDPEDDDDDDDAPSAAPSPFGGYGTMSARADAIASKHLASLLSTFALNHDTSRDGVVTALALEGQVKALASEVAGLIAVHARHQALRKKEGRTLSSATRSRIKDVQAGIQSLLSDLSSLLAETEPKPKDRPMVGDDSAKSSEASAVTSSVESPSASADPASSDLLRRRRTRLKIRTALLGIDQ